MSAQIAPFDWLTPDYAAIWRQRVQRLARLRADPNLLQTVRAYYKDHHAADFINDWGVTVDPRNVGTVRPVVMPFQLFPRQREMIDWLDERWQTKDDGIVVKSRDCGASWLAMAFSVWVSLFWENATIGFGSAKEEKVDAAGDPGSLFYKGRMFIQYLPPEFKGPWNLKQNSVHRRLMFPTTESAIVGQAGDNIGRGDRTSLFFVDEFAVVERPKVVDSNLIATTECRIEMSTVQGLANVFAERARGGKITRFDFHYRDDPRKTYRDEHGVIVLYEWFAKKKAKADPVTWNQEYECDFLASVEGIIIPQEWVQACIGAAQKLGIAPTGEHRAAYDVADRGIDKNCFASSYGVELQHIESWSGSNSTIYKSVERVFRECDTRKVASFDYDGDGMGAGVRGDAEKISEERETAGRPTVTAFMFRGSGAVADPENICPGTDRLNKDFFENYKAQCWWALRQRARATWEWVVNGTPCDPSDILSISPDLPELTKTCGELSQPVWTWSKSGKMVIDKTPDDVASPNNGDTVMMLFPYSRPAMAIHDSILEMFGNGNQENL